MIAATTKTGKPYTRPASRYEEPWINAVRDAARGVRRHVALQPPYAVRMTLKLEEPKRHTYAWSTKHDLDKLVRAVMDGLVRGKLIEDDRHVVEIAASKCWAQSPERAGVEVWVSGISDDYQFSDAALDDPPG